MRPRSQQHSSALPALRQLSMEPWPHRLRRLPNNLFVFIDVGFLLDAAIKGGGK